MLCIPSAGHTAAADTHGARRYDAHMDQKLREVPAMIDELTRALPPLPAGTRVADLCSGSGCAPLLQLVRGAAE